MEHTEVQLGLYLLPCHPLELAERQRALEWIAQVGSLPRGGHLAADGPAIFVGRPSPHASKYQTVQYAELVARRLARVIGRQFDYVVVGNLSDVDRERISAN